MASLSPAEGQAYLCPSALAFIRTGQAFTCHSPEGQQEAGGIKKEPPQHFCCSGLYRFLSGHCFRSFFFFFF